MIVSRGLTLLRLSNTAVKTILLQNGRQKLTGQIKRHSHGGEFYYRRAPETHPRAIKVAEILGGFFWWWMVWHFLTDYHELFGPTSYPDPASWTDEELGIPPEDAD